MRKTVFYVALLFLYAGASLAQVRVRTYYDSLEGKPLKELFFYKNKKEKVLHGPYVRYTVSGKTEARGRFSNGKKDSVFTEYFPDAGPRLSVTYREGIRHGSFYVYHPNGNLFQKGRFVNDSIQDTTYTYYETGLLKAKGTFRGDKINGLLVSYYPSGKLRQWAEYQDNRPDGITRNYREDGITLVSEEQFKYGRPEGPGKTFYPNGKTETESSNKNGLKHGPFKSYSPEGKLMMDAVYVNGVLDGKAVTYYDNGAVKGRFSYSKGNKEGSNVLYYPNGDKMEETVLDAANGIQEEKTYYTGSRLRSVTAFKLDKRLGPVKEGLVRYYYPSGKDSLVAHYRLGKRWDDFSSFYPNGKLRFKYPYFSDYKQGTGYEYYETGILKAEITFRRDELSGKAQYFNEKGVLTSQGNLVLGKKNGPWTVYNGAGKPEMTEVYKLGKLVRTDKYLSPPLKERRIEHKSK